MTRWTAPPDRREVSLLLFALTVFALAYNLENSFQLLGLDPASGKSTAVLGQLGLRTTKEIGRDGRRPHGDALEDKIFGTWKWEDGHVAGHGRERSQGKGVGPHSAMWKKLSDIPKLDPSDGTVDHAIMRWSQVPETTLVKHVPGHTILDNVIFFKGKMYIVTDSPDRFPVLSDICSTKSMGMLNDWTILSTDDAWNTLGNFGAFVNGVTWLSAEAETHNSTLFAFWRTYSSLDPHVSLSGETTLEPPVRLIYPHHRFFTDPNPDPKDHLIRRARVETGYHPFLLKAAYPTMTAMFFEDWEDYQRIPVPWVFERVVVIDPQAAKQLSAKTPYAPAIESLQASPNWFEPIRRSLKQYLDVPAEGGKKVVVYVHTQDQEPNKGLQLNSRDHTALVKALKSLGPDYEVHILSSLDQYTEWKDRLSSIVRAQVMIGVHGKHLMDSIYLQRASTTTLIELFPKDTFSRDYQMAVQSLGTHYVAFSGDQKFSGSSLPAFAPPDESSGQRLSVDVDVVVRTVRESFSR